MGIDPHDIHGAIRHERLFRGARGASGASDGKNANRHRQKGSGNFSGEVHSHLVNIHPIDFV